MSERQTASRVAGAPALSAAFVPMGFEDLRAVMQDYGLAIATLV
jgi:hypothetical protein